MGKRSEPFVLNSRFVHAERAVAELNNYADGTPAMLIYYEADQFTATINLVDYGRTPDAGTLFLRTGKECEGVLEALVQAKIVEDMGIRIPYGRGPDFAAVVKPLF